MTTAEADPVDTTAAPAARPGPARAHEWSLAIDGMTCGACVGRVEKALARVPGVRTAEVNLATERARVSMDPAATRDPRASSDAVDVDDGAAAALLAALRGAGYDGRIVGADRPKPPGPPTAGEGATGDARVATTDADADTRARAAVSARDGRRVVVAALLTAPLLWSMLASMVGGVGGALDPVVQATLAALVQFGCGARFYRGAWHALKAGSGNMDLLVALGTSAAFGLSAFTLWSNAHGHAASGAVPHVYFETSAVVVTLVLFGKWLEARTKRRTSSALRALAALQPATATVVQDGVERVVPIDAIAPGTSVVVRPGAQLPVDGVVVDGATDVDESLVTGESRPVAKAVGDAVIAGSVNGAGRIVVRATALGATSTLGRIVAMVESAQAKKAPMQHLVDRVSAVFVPVVIALAIVTFAGWTAFDGDWRHALLNAVAVLVVACPCALGLATPAAMLVGTGAAARRGILIRDADVLERAQRITRVAFDKTGTLTAGRPVLVDHAAADGDRSMTLALMAAVESGSEHPLARAIADEARRLGVTVPASSDTQALAGDGVSARVDGRTLFAIGPRAADAMAFERGALAGPAACWTEAGRTIAWLVERETDDAVHASAAASCATASTAVAARGRGDRDGPPRSTSTRALGVFAFDDAIRPDARGAVDHLHALGIDVALWSGDQPVAVAAVAQALGIERHEGALRPADKAARVAAWRDEGHGVAMVGDGINDAPALAAADVGIAMSTGTDVAMQVAGITLLRGDPTLVADALDIARRTHAKIRQNLFWAFVYNAIGLPLAALGLLSPMLAGLAMALSSVSVIGNALRLRRWKGVA